MTVNLPSSKRQKSCFLNLGYAGVIKIMAE
jgi:hypothetical protein